MTITFHYTNLDDTEENNYSTLWSWYTTNLDTGNFEELTKNVTIARKLDRFITNNCKHYDSVILILLIPTLQINKAPGLLSHILNKFYDDGFNHNLDITPIGSIQELRSTVLMVKDDSTPPNINVNKELGQNNVPSSIDMNSFISGESGYLPSEYSKQNKLNKNDSYVGDSSKTTTDFNSSLNLQRFDCVSVSNSDSDSLSQSEFGSECDIGSITGVPSSKVSTVEFENDQVNSQTRELGSSSQNFNQYQCDSESISSSNTASLKTFPTSVSVITTFLNHSLILKSILFKSFQDGSKTTAIRQFGGGKMSDDWLLYDDDFSLNNLQLLDLHEILEITKFASKVLFYSLDTEEQKDDEDIHNDYDDDYLDDDDEIGDNDLTVTQFNGIDDELTHSIKFVNTNTTNAITPTVLSKTSTLRTNHESIKSEYLIHKVDTSYSSIQKSKSAPIIGKKNKRRNSKRLNDKSCVIS